MSLIQKLGTWNTIQKSTVACSMYMFDNAPRIKSKYCNYSTFEPSNLLLSKNVKDMTSVHAAAFSGAHHTAGLGALGPNMVECQIDVRDGLVLLQHLDQGLEAAMDQGWRPNFWPSRPSRQEFISQFLKTKMTF